MANENLNKIIHFNTSDGVKLNGILFKNNVSKKIVISVHGMATNCIKKREEVIAEKLNDINIDYLVFNNRGHEIINYSTKVINNVSTDFLGGTAYEIFDDCYYDIDGAIKYALQNGYEKIYLLGHSLGSTKVVYFYNKIKKEKNNELLDKINGIILLSLVDLPFAQKVYSGEKYKEVLKYAETLEKQNKLEEIMPYKSFIYPISARVYLRYFRDNEDINFAQYSNLEYKYEYLNNIEIPLFMRWGNNKELIMQNAEDLSKELRLKINNKKSDINYIDGADHSYTNKEIELAEEIKKFMQKR